MQSWKSLGQIKLSLAMHGAGQNQKFLINQALGSCFEFGADTVVSSADAVAYPSIQGAQQRLRVFLGAKRAR